jgi:leucyl aminopeptidase (aminopeptidase T)
LQVAPAAVDKILELNGTLDPLVFTVKDGKIVDVRREKK